MYDEQVKSSLAAYSAKTPAYDMPDATQEREPQMLRAVSRQSSVVSELEEICKLLENRLRGVLRVDDRKIGDESKPERPLPALVQAVDAATDRVHKINVYVSDLINRLEV